MTGACRPFPLESLELERRRAERSRAHSNKWNDEEEEDGFPASVLVDASSYAARRAESSSAHGALEPWGVAAKPASSSPSGASSSEATHGDTRNCRSFVRCSGRAFSSPRTAAAQSSETHRRSA